MALAPGSCGVFAPMHCTDWAGVAPDRTGPQWVRTPPPAAPLPCVWSQQVDRVVRCVSLFLAAAIGRDDRKGAYLQCVSDIVRELVEVPAPRLVAESLQSAPRGAAPVFRGVSAACARPVQTFNKGLTLKVT